MSLEGQQLGRYHFQRLLGSGGMGDVYLATDTIINRQVAVKVIRAEATPYPDANATREAARLFQREMKAIASLDHPHILPLYDYGESRVNDGTFTYMVMPYRPEGSLTSWLLRRGRAEPLSPQEVTSLVDQAASALQHAHNRQVIHQDVKPANFLIQSNEENPSRPNLLLADFGVAKFSSATSSASQAVRGTPTSMAPEQWEGHPVPATDQYALAVMAYELLTGRPPFQGGLSQVMFQHFHTPPPAPSTFNPRIPRAIDAVLLHALAKRPDERFPAIFAFARAFQEAVQQAALSSAASAPAPWTGPDIRATLAISTEEALSGTSRTLTLPGGRRVTVSVPAGAYDGQAIRLEGQAEPTGGGGPAGALILTLAVQRPEEGKELSDASVVEKTVRASNPDLQFPAVSASDLDLQQPLIPPPPPGFEPLPPTMLAGAPSAYKPTIQVGDPNLPPTVASTPSPPGGIRPGLAPAHPGSGAPGLSRLKGRGILLIGLALLIIASGVAGIFYVVRSNQVATAHVNATATAAARNAAGTAEVNATGTAYTASLEATVAANAIGTATAYQDLYNSATSGTPALSDPLHDNSIGNQWSEGTNTVGGSCAFSGGAYHASISGTNSFIDCVSTSSDFSNFAYQVKMKIIKGDAGGVVFRSNATNGTYYVFAVGQDGSYQFFVCPPKVTTCNSPLASGSSGAINQGLNQTNVVTVVVKGNTITLYVNQQEIDSETDNTFSHGQIGVVADESSSPTEVVYSNAKVWTL